MDAANVTLGALLMLFSLLNFLNDTVDFRRAVVGSTTLLMGFGCILSPVYGYSGSVVWVAAQAAMFACILWAVISGRKPKRRLVSGKLTVRQRHDLRGQDD